MKITRIGPSFPLLTASTLGGGGGSVTPSVGSGLVPVSTGSNGWAWGSNVGTISVNSTTVVLGPAVNFADGSNTTLSVSSNTIRVHVPSSVSPLTTKGDLYTYSTANDRLAVGSNGTGVIADSMEPKGIRYSRASMVGEVLILDTPAGSPLVFADLIQNEAQDDLLYEDM